MAKFFLIIMFGINKFYLENNWMKIFIGIFLWYAYAIKLALSVDSFINFTSSVGFNSSILQLQTKTTSSGASVTIYFADNTIGGYSGSLVELRRFSIGPQTLQTFYVFNYYHHYLADSYCGVVSGGTSIYLASQYNPSAKLILTGFVGLKYVSVSNFVYNILSSSIFLYKLFVCSEDTFFHYENGNIRNLTNLSSGTSSRNYIASVINISETQKLILTTLKHAFLVKFSISLLLYQSHHKIIDLTSVRNESIISTLIDKEQIILVQFNSFYLYAFHKLNGTVVTITDGLQSMVGSSILKAIQPAITTDGQRVLIFNDKTLRVNLSSNIYSYLSSTQSALSLTSWTGLSVMNSSETSNFVYQLNSSTIYAYCQTTTISSLLSSCILNINCSITNCLTCNMARTNCLTCKVSYTLFNNTCYSNSNCSVSNCSVCNSTGKCLQCKTNYILNSTSNICTLNASAVSNTTNSTSNVTTNSTTNTTTNTTSNQTANSTPDNSNSISNDTSYYNSSITTNNTDTNQTIDPYTNQTYPVTDNSTISNGTVLVDDFNITVGDNVTVLPNNTVIISGNYSLLDPTLNQTTGNFSILAGDSNSTLLGPTQIYPNTTSNTTTLGPNSINNTNSTRNTNPTQNSNSTANITSNSPTNKLSTMSQLNKTQIQQIYSSFDPNVRQLCDISTGINSFPAIRTFLRFLGPLFSFFDDYWYYIYHSDAYPQLQVMPQFLVFMYIVSNQRIFPDYLDFSTFDIDHRIKSDYTPWTNRRIYVIDLEATYLTDNIQSLLFQQYFLLAAIWIILKTINLILTRCLNSESRKISFLRRFKKTKYQTEGQLPRQNKQKGVLSFINEYLSQITGFKSVLMSLIGSNMIFMSFVFSSQLRIMFSFDSIDRTNLIFTLLVGASMVFFTALFLVYDNIFQKKGQNQEEKRQTFYITYFNHFKCIVFGFIHGFFISQPNVQYVLLILTKIFFIYIIFSKKEILRNGFIQFVVFMYFFVGIGIDLMCILSKNQLIPSALLTNVQKDFSVANILELIFIGTIIISLWTQIFSETYLDIKMTFCNHSSSKTFRAKTIFGLISKIVPENVAKEEKKKNRGIKQTGTNDYLYDNEGDVHDGKFERQFFNKIIRQFKFSKDQGNLDQTMTQKKHKTKPKLRKAQKTNFQVLNIGINIEFKKKKQESEDNIEQILSDSNSVETVKNDNFNLHQNHIKFEFKRSKNDSNVNFPKTYRLGRQKQNHRSPIRNQFKKEETQSLTMQKQQQAKKTLQVKEETQNNSIAAQFKFKGRKLRAYKKQKESDLPEGQKTFSFQSL